MKLTSNINLLNIFKDKSFLGVDIGTSSIKVVQLSRHKGKYKLDTYGEIRFFESGSKEEVQEESLKILDDQVAELLRKIMAESNVTSKKVAMSIPVFSSFSTVIQMPDLEKNELKKAIEFQARQYVPAPIDQVSLSSVILKREASSKNLAGGKLEVLLIAIPNEVQSKYKNIASLSNLDVVSLEVETFPMARSIIKEPKGSVLIIDIGSKSTNYCVVNNGFVRVSHNYDISGASLTKAFLDFAGGDYQKAESLKRSMGINVTPGQMSSISGVIGFLESISSEADRIISEYYNKTAHRVDKVVLSGGSANMPGLVKYFSEKLGLDVQIADPFSDIIYPKEIEATLKKMGPSFAIAVGLAMRK